MFGFMKKYFESKPRQVRRVNVGEATLTIILRAGMTLETPIRGYLREHRRPDSLHNLRFPVEVKEVFADLVEKSGKRGFLMSPEMDHAINIKDIKEMKLENFKQFFVEIPVW